jgi:hypothetical protein
MWIFSLSRFFLHLMGGKPSIKRSLVESQR